jgi:RHS repeat-associated protein
MTVAGNTTTYAYDDNDRITSVTPPSPASVINYTWDDNGDLTARGSDSFSWDYEDRMVSATVNSVTTSFAYRGDGLRDSRSVSGGATTTFTWDIAGRLPVVLDDGNQYLYGAGLTAQNQSGNWFYYLADGLGSTMAVVNASGVVQDSYTYDVYGKPAKTGSLANEFDFAGQQTDGTGLQYLRARYMDPETGTFASRDPLVSVGGAYLGGGYRYGGGNPARFTDRRGLCDDGSPVCLGATGGPDANINSVEPGCPPPLLACGIHWKQTQSLVVGGKGGYDPLGFVLIPGVGIKIKDFISKFGLGVCIDWGKAEYRIVDRTYQSTDDPSVSARVRVKEWRIAFKVGIQAGISIGKAQVGWGCVGVVDSETPWFSTAWDGEDQGVERTVVKVE